MLLKKKPSIFIWRLMSFHYFMLITRNLSYCHFKKSRRNFLCFFHSFDFSVDIFCFCVNQLNYKKKLIFTNKIRNNCLKYILIKLIDFEAIKIHIFLIFL